MNRNQISYIVINGLSPKMSEKYEVKENNLLLKEDGRIYVPVDERSAIIQQFLDDPRTTGGRDRLFENIRKQYSNVSRNDVAEHLRNDPTHQIHRPLKRQMRIRPIVTNDKGKIAQVDLIDVSNYAGHNNGTRYLITYVDIFSKFAAVRPLTNKKQENVTNALMDILNGLEAHNRPSTIQADNGSEFQSLMERTLAVINIKLIHSSPYSPTSQGIIERFNKTLKGLIFEYMTRSGTKRYIHILQDAVDNLNNVTHSSTKQKPIDLMREEKLSEEKKQEIKENIAQSRKAVGEEEMFEKGDYVRVALITNKEIRKQKFRKKILANWSSEVYQVHSRSDPQYAGVAAQYQLKNLQTNRVAKKKYYSYQLLKTSKPKETTEVNESTVTEEEEQEEQEEEQVQAPVKRVSRVSERWKPSQAFINALNST